MKTAEELAEALGLRCAAAAEHRGDTLSATAPPAIRWLLIEHRAPWPRKALTALGDGLAGEVARLCAAAGIRPVLIRRHGRQDRSTTRRWALIDSRPGQESVHWGDLPTDEHLLNVLSGRDPGTPSTDPIYLICTHGRHDACCAIRGRPAAAALSTAFPDRTWECSHIGGDRFAANLVFLPHSLFYGHVPSTKAVDLATHYNEGLIVPEYLRGSGAHPPPVQAAQHFARTAGAPLSLNALHPTQVRTPTPTTWQIHLTTTPDTNTPTHPTTSAAAHTNADADTKATGATQPPGSASADATQAKADARTDTTASANTGTEVGANTNASTTGRTDTSASADASATGRTDTSASAGAPARRGADAYADARGRESGSTNAGDSIQADAADPGVVYVVTVTAGATTIDAAMTCASQPPGHVTTYTLTALEKLYQ
ncbi:sucrase ferredoxin [Kribbella ginsengisoli]|uniref:Sucrase ferredoxin n=1 Tax=Kribbella ginsengisoli TaxID=363865 RepID=A0ABP6Y3U4_9ACTN